MTSNQAPCTLLQGIAFHAEGEANFYRLMRNGNWLARVQFNGELLVWDQEQLLSDMLQGQQAAPAGEREAVAYLLKSDLKRLEPAYVGGCSASLSKTPDNGFVAIYTDPQPSAVPDGVRKVIDYLSQSLHQASDGTVPCGEDAIVECIALLEHASAPTAVQGGALPYWVPCNPGCDPELGGHRSKDCTLICHNAREAITAAQQAGGSV